MARADVEAHSAELAIETIKRHLELQRTLFDANDQIVALLTDVEKYINEGLRVCQIRIIEWRVLHEWEELGNHMRAPVAVATLQRFVCLQRVHRYDEHELRAIRVEEDGQDY